MNFTIPKWEAATLQSPSSLYIGYTKYIKYCYNRHLFQCIWVCVLKQEW